MSRLKQFLDEYQSANTRNTYRYALGQFCKSVYGAGEVAGQADRYLEEERDYEGDVKCFLTSLNGRPPKSVTMMLAVVSRSARTRRRSHRKEHATVMRLSHWNRESSAIIERFRMLLGCSAFKWA